MQKENRKDILCRCVGQTMPDNKRNSSWENKTRSITRQGPRRAGKLPDLHTPHPAFGHPLPQGAREQRVGFTLIELLVVVLIIGILAAVALPQYQKAVEKSKATQAQTLLKSVYQAAKAYQLANGNWPSSFDELTVEIPWTGNKNWAAVGHYRQGISNNDWSIQLRAPLSDAGPTSNASGVVIGRISGPYKGAGFQIYQQTFSAIANTVPTDEVHCIEGKSASLHPQTTFSKTTGSYCIKLFKGTKVADSGFEYIYRL